MAAGVASNAVGSYKTAQGQKAALNYQSAVAQNNATIAQYQAQIALENGAAEEQASELRTAAMKGDQRAMLAANGVDLGTGSATEILATTEFMGKRDALTIRDNASRQAWAINEQAKGYASEAAMDQATASAINPAASAFSSLLSGAGQVAGSWYGYNKSINGRGTGTGTATGTSLTGK